MTNSVNSDPCREHGTKVTVLTRESPFGTEDDSHAVVNLEEVFLSLAWGRNPRIAAQRRHAIGQRVPGFRPRAKNKGTLPGFTRRRNLGEVFSGVAWGVNPRSGARTRRVASSC
jgi:hypothetical protein